MIRQEGDRIPPPLFHSIPLVLLEAQEVRKGKVVDTFANGVLVRGNNGTEGGVDNSLLNPLSPSLSTFHYGC